MPPRILLILPLVLAACVPTTGTRVTSDGLVVNPPEALVALAAPGQNLETIRLLDDGCFWYSHTGPVETTLLPLRTAAGRPICNGPAAGEG